VAEDGGQRRHDRDEKEQRPGQDVEQREHGDEGHRRQRHDVVEEHEPDAPVPVEQRPGNRGDEQPGEDAGEGHQAGEGGRPESVEREQDERDADHRLRHARHLHRDEHASQVRDAQQGTVGGRGGVNHGRAIVP
jgi:hypothetical protein